MKKLTAFLLFITASASLTAQTNLPIDSTTKKISFTQTIDCKGSKAELFDKSVDWFALNFKSSKDVLQVKDKEAGKLVGSFIVYNSEGGPVDANIIILVKDNKFRYTITDIVFSGNGQFKPWTFEEEVNPWKVGMMKKGINFIKKESISSIQNLISSFRENMSKPSISEGF
ncbi:DUF4468 domain-containing protein [Pedobacter antarcticus]|uniref:DUF4468 domain-containing protein n=1 Tax=Pedobacter antarcticus TaxID=34086 RepID=UPI0015A21F27|nr:DUF4468 domain-containing protein [Pedobacter antarcticus]